jgi:copper(I)-binding protein
MKRVRPLLVCAYALAMLAAAHGAAGRDTAVADLRIVHAYARATPPGARTAAAYLTIESTGTAPDRLLGARSAQAAAVELHSMAHEGGMMRMRAVPHVDVPARGSVRLEPGGLHLMIVDPRAPLRAGERFPLTLTFARAGNVDVEVDVEPLVTGK